MPLLLSSIIFFYGGWIFIIGAWREIRSYLPGMMTLISIAISTAYFWSIYAVFAHEETLFWEIATLITIMFLGHYIEMRTIGGTQNALRELAKLLPDTAEIIQNDKIKTIAVSELNENDIILVRPGAQIPADGKIIDGESNINESMVTGESNPVFKKKDDFVVAGTINGDGALKIRVTNI
ncbi:TPA: hypothetical protein DEG21_00850 [Patescibacteria group bacterium]|nr:hypothetical protein [Candidatus Gracilibacteria bacterium]HBY74467.1 hypothetical protein [Candidatus Gracilibacteria bacterium]